jgi:RHS repeat-associated protein
MKPHHRFFGWLTTASLLVLLLSQLLGNFAGLPVSVAFAATKPQAKPGSLTLQQFLRMGRHDSVYRGLLIPPATTPNQPASTSQNNAKPLPSAEPPTMKPISQPLTAAFLAASNGVQPLDLRGSDQRLEVVIPPGAFDLTHATLPDGKPFISTPATTCTATPLHRCSSTSQAQPTPLTFSITEIHGHFAATMNMLGEYQVQLLAVGQPLSGVLLRQPLTFVYHYQPWELEALDLNPAHLILSWPDLALADIHAHHSTSSDILLLQDNPQQDTLTAQRKRGLSFPGVPFDMGGGDPNNTSPVISHLASVEGNAGQFTYSYPLAVVPGSGGFAPDLSLEYSSEEPNNRANRLSAAGDEGDGWSLTLGSITKDVYPNGSKDHTDWYFINDVGNVSDRLVLNTKTNQYETEHLSHLRIVESDNCGGNGGQPCFFVWDESGAYYVFGDTPDSLQYHTDPDGTRHNYEWDLDEIVAPNEGPNSTYDMIQIKYVQDITDDMGNSTVRDAAVEEIVYGFGTSTSTISTVAGTVDFSYLAPFSDSPWTTQYGSSYHCDGTPPSGTNHMRCDDPQNYSDDSPLLDTDFSTMSLMSVTSYVGTDSGNKAYSYSFTYQDQPFSICYDPYTLVKEYCAGEHLLTSITPTVYQQGTGHTLKPTLFGYTGGSQMENYYYDSGNKNEGNNQYSVQTWWSYLTSWYNSDTGEGEQITYQRAFNNTEGTPWQYLTRNGQQVLEDRYDPFYCTLYACTGNYAYPYDRAWSMQVVTQIAAWGTDSSSSQLYPAITTYSYRLANTGTYQAPPYCTPGTGPSPQPSDYEDCVGDNWIPPSDSDWQDYFHAEFHGFATVFITDPAGNLTVDYYDSTDGWNHPETDSTNFNSGALYEEDTYNGTWATPSAEISSTLTNYPQDNHFPTSFPNPATGSACMSSNLPSGTVYIPCESMPINTESITYNGNTSLNAPTVTMSDIFDDYDNTNGLQLGGNYHNLKQEQITASNTPTPALTPLTETLSYTTNDQTINNWVYYTVDKVTQSSLTDGSSHVWACQKLAYDEASTAPATPAQGLLTTATTYSDCSNKSGTAINNYAAYDATGNLIATVDGVAAANYTYYTGGSGCPLHVYPMAYGGGWSPVYYQYVTCTTYDSTDSLPESVTNAFNQTSYTTYDPTQGNIPTSVEDPNTWTTSTNYIYDPNSATNGKVTVQVNEPNEQGNYTTESSTYSVCPTSLPSSSAVLMPCYETDSDSSTYNSAVTRTFYDNEGRAVETLTPVPTPVGGNQGTAYDSVVFTVYNDAQNSVYVSQPFTVAAQLNGQGTYWVDPNNAVDYQGHAVYGTATYYDGDGRPIAMDDAIFNANNSSGIPCPSLGTNATACTVYGLGSVSGDANVYETTESIDPNDHVSEAFSDALGETVYTQDYSGLATGTLTPVAQTAYAYNALGEAISVTATDLQPLSGESATPIVATASYDDMGRLTKVIDPDRGKDNYTYDADGHVVSDVQTDIKNNDTRTLGYVYDLLGRLGCVQDQAASTPTPNTTGACTSGANPYVQNTYDTSELTLPGTTDNPIGELTKSVSTTYFPDSASPTATMTTTQTYEHDPRGQLIGSQVQFGLPSSWNVTNALPTYQLALTYNDADQVTNTTTSTINSQNQSTPGYTTIPVYDSATGALTGLNTDTTSLATMQFNTNALLSTLTLQGGSGPMISEQFTYDGDLRPASETACWVSSGCGGSGTLFSQARSYDSVGNVTSLSTTLAAVPGQSNSGGSETENFCYNEQDELVWAGNSGTQPGAGTGTCGSATLQSGINGASFNKSYVYTHLGQLWQVTDNLAGSTSQYLYCNSNFPHQLQGIYTQGATCSNPGTALYTSSYKDSSNNDWGDVTSRTVGTNPTATLSYDHLDHLTMWQGGLNGSEEEWNAYDASGERVLTRSTNGSTTTMAVYAFGLEEYDYDGSGNLSGSLHYYSLNGRLIGVLKQMKNSSGKDFLFEDELGSVLADVNRQTGTLVGNQLYDPYGNTRYQSGTISTNLGFTGQYGDAMTGLDYYNARWYDPAAGVFLQADTVQGNLAGMNPYAYVGGNPETFTDPTGQFFPHCHCGSAQFDHANPFLHHRQYGARRVVYREDKAFEERQHALQHAADPFNAHWGGIFGHISARVVFHVAVFALNAFTGVFSMMHEIHTIFNSKASWGERVKAGIGLAVNLALDTSDLWMGHLAEFAFQGLGHIAEGLGHAFEGAEDVARVGEDIGREGDVTLYRGTSRASEIAAFSDSGGHIFSDAARSGYLEARYAGSSIEEALRAAMSASEEAHLAQLSEWGSLNDYVQAHGAFGQEISEFGPRSMISFSRDPNIAAYFAHGGNVFSVTVPAGSAIGQTLPGAGEGEWLIMHMIKVDGIL